jgi:RNA polymerase sigma-70 factor (ECF subfamily)
MAEAEWLAEQFEEHRSRLRAVAYRMLGSLTEADDAVQDAWVRVSRAETDEVENLGGWLTTVVARVCLNMLRARTNRREQAWDGHLPDPIVSPPGDLAPEEEVLLADSVGLALQVVLDALSPAERLAFVLHDMFELPFEEIAPMVGRTPDAARQLASRARRRVRGADTAQPDTALVDQRAVVDAFYAAARHGDLEALIAVLHPDVVLRTDFGRVGAGATREIRGSEAVARQAQLGAAPASELHPALVNGTPGAVVTRQGRPFAVMAFTVSGGRITEIDIVGDPKRVARVAASVLGANHK